VSFSGPRYHQDGEPGAPMVIVTERVAAGEEAGQRLDLDPVDPGEITR
jgi:hypothetical protein